MMNRLRRTLAILCLACLALTLMPLPALAADRSFEQNAALGRGLSVATLNRKGDDGSARQMFVLDYSPGQAVTPIVAYGAKLYGKSDINYAVQYAESLGYTVLAAVNADFFNLDTGVPTGMVVQNGRLCVSDGAWNAVAFFADGTAMTGTPRLSMSYTRLSNGQTTEIYAFNKVRTKAGIYLYSEDFAATTKTTAAGAEVVLDITPGDFLHLGQPLTATVSAIHRTTPGTAIGPNQLVMSLTEGNTGGATFGDLQVGETITISATTADPRWHNAVYACGAGNLLAQNGQLTASATAAREPRTVLGVRPDGSVSVLVCDGRQTGISDGISLLEAAQILLGRGCVNVVNLDGGGSTALSYRDAGYETVAVKNSPSDGSLRKCANYIVFVNSGNPYGAESTVITYPRNSLMLAGASLSLTARGVNDDFFPTGAYSRGFQVLQGDGFIDGDLYIAPEYAGVNLVGTADPGVSDLGATVEVIDQPQSISLVRSGSTVPLTTLAVGLDSVTDLDIYLTDGLRRITAQDAQFTFAATGGIGAIDAQGVLTAGSAPGLTGTVTATWRDYTVTLPVTVGKAPVVLDSFEGEGEYTVIIPEIEGETSGAHGLASLSKAPENARYGVGSLRLTYDTKLAHESVRFAAAQPYALTGGANIISLLVQGKGDFGVDFVTPDGIQRVPITVTEQWQYITVGVPADATAVAGFSASGEGSATGAVYIDQLMAHYGQAANDITPPVVEGMAYDPETGLLTAVVTDNYPMPITADMVGLKMDATVLPVNFDPETGILTAQLTEVPDGIHRLTLTVRDYFLNTTRKSVVIGQTAETLFEDMDGHWAQDFVEYLRAQGVLSDDAQFWPQEKVYNEMAATMISRFMGVDVTQYEHLEMPYADADRISEWAAPHVKAMYYENIMIGSTDAQGNRVFNPRVASSRAQVMTILGRTLPRGYAYPAAPFDDYADIPQWARDHIDLLYSMEIVNGYAGTNQVKPNETITRAEIASLFFKIF